VKTTQQAAANWVAAQGRAVVAYEQGVQGYSGDWAGATTSQQQTMLNNVTQAITSGRWAAGVQAVGTAGWKAKTVAKSNNYSGGYSTGAADQAIAIGKIINALSAIVPSLPPRGDFNANKLRSTTLMDALHAQRGQLGAK
jgi:hypothetical protein